MTHNTDTNESPAYAKSRTLKSYLVHDAQNVAYVVIEEREAVDNFQPPYRRRWNTEKVSLTIPELRRLAAKYLKETL
jgi:hypothetical protein